jgi:ribosomal protein S18 acetylase RimI-like enzyme
MRVREVPLMVLREGRWRTPEPPDGVTVRLLAPGDPALASTGAVQHIAFANPGTAVGQAGPAERDASAVGQSAVELDFLSERIRNGRTQPAVAEDESGVLAGGSHQLMGGVSAIVGVATLPSARRRGLAALVTARLVQDARERGAEIVFIEAEDDDVARIYGRLGFERIGTACIAEPL